MENHSEEQAKLQLASVREMAAAVRSAEKAKDCDALDRAADRIREDALSVEMRSQWHSPGSDDPSVKYGEFQILLCTGGPAVRIIGNLSEHGEPETARIEHQDWGTPWTELRLTAHEEEDVLTYCCRFCFES